MLIFEPQTSRSFPIGFNHVGGRHPTVSDYSEQVMGIPRHAGAEGATSLGHETVICINETV